MGVTVRAEIADSDSDGCWCGLAFQNAYIRYFVRYFVVDCGLFYVILSCVCVFVYLLFVHVHVVCLCVVTACAALFISIRHSGNVN